MGKIISHFLEGTLINQENQIFTIEPGIYFIPMLLNKLREHSTLINWSAIDELLPCGGIRIEDDVVCTAEGHEVLTASTPKAREEVTVLVGAAI